MITPEIQQYVQQQIALARKQSLYSTDNSDSGTHNGIDGKRIKYSDLIGAPSGNSSIAGRSTSPATFSRTDDGGSGTLVDLSVNDFSQGITWDGTGHGFVCVTPGFYVVIGSVWLTSVSVNNICAAILYKNGSIFAAGYQDAFQTAQVFTVSDVVQLAVGDEVYLYSSVQNGTSYNINGNATRTFLSIASA